MTPTIAFLLSMTFLISIGGLFLLVWSLANDQWGNSSAAAETIFAEGEIGTVEDPASTTKNQQSLQAARSEISYSHLVDNPEVEERHLLDQSSQKPVLLWLSSSIGWLLLGSIFGLVASVKLHLR